MSRAIKISRKPNFLLSSFSTIASSSSSTKENKRLSPSKPKSKQPSPPPISMASYLINNLSFPPSEAESISSKYLANLTSTSNPDAVVAFLRSDADLSPSQLRHFFRRRPSLLLSSVPSTLLPKLAIFRSLLPSGRPPAALASLVSTCAASFGFSPSRLLAALSLLQSLLLHDNPKVVTALRRYPRLLTCHPDKVIARNAALLRSRGLGDPAKLAHFIHMSPIALILSPPRLELAFSIVEREFGIAMGEDGDEDCINAVALAATLPEEGFVERIEVLRRFGIGDKDMLVLFRRNPGFMRLKVDHMVRKLEFLRDEVGFGPGEIVCNAWVLMLSLETRLMPRNILVKALKDEGLVTWKVNMRIAFLMSEAKFDMEFVDKFKEGKGEDVVRRYLSSLEAKKKKAASPV